MHNPDKVGRDAGELIGLAPTGVVATSDVDALLALDADCLCYLGDGIGPRAPEAVAEMCRFLERRTQRGSTSLNQLVYPKTAAPELRDPLEAACRAGNTSFFNNGADPGFGSDLIPLTLLSLMDEIESVRVQEIVNYNALRPGVGHARPVRLRSAARLPGAALHERRADRVLGRCRHARSPTRWAWSSTRSARCTSSRRSTVDVDVASARIPAGTVAAIRFEVQGIVDGEPAIVVEHDTRIHDDAAPDWPQLPRAATTATRCVARRPAQAHAASSTWRTSTAATAASSPARCGS